MREASDRFSWNAGEVETGLDITAAIRHELLAFYGAMVNGYCGDASSLEYHDLIVGDWLISYSHTLYAEWRDVISGIGASEPAEVFGTPCFLDTQQFFEGSTTIEWHQHLRSAIRRYLSGDWKPMPPAVCEKKKRSEGSIRNRLAERISPFVGSSAPEVMFVSPFTGALSPQTYAATLWRWRAWASFVYLKSCDLSSVGWNWAYRSEWYDAVRDTPHDADFLQLAKALMSIYLPLALLEGRGVLKHQAMALRLPRPRSIFTCSALHGNLVFKQLAAEWKTEGTRIHVHQHGGGYGMEQKLAFEDYELRMADRYYSWGWQRDGCDIRPLSPAWSITKRFQRHHRAQMAGILLFCLDCPRVPYRLMFTPMPGTIEDMHSSTYSFIETIARKEQLTIRPYPVSYGWRAAEKMRQLSPKSKFDRKTPSRTLFGDVAVVVVNYLGTAWLETMGRNVPTICFYDPAVYKMRPEVIPLLQHLLSVGVLHHSGASAARFLNDLGSNIASWWASNEVQNARASFACQYARYTTNWQSEWERELRP